jgi:formate--tetrahydrofolate ligase
MVITIRALKMQGGIAKNRLKMENLDGIKKGFANLSKHLENIQLFGLPVVVAINMFPSDTEREIKFTLKICEDIGVPVAVSEVFKKGGEGGTRLAEEVLKALKKRSRFRYLYSLDQPVKEKIEAIATHIYGAKRVVYTVKADRDIEHLHRLELENLPICMAKTQFSLSDDPKLLGRPRGFKITVREVRISAGAGFIVPLTGTITTMPGLPRHPAAERMDIDAHGKISGLF